MADNVKYLRNLLNILTIPRFHRQNSDDKVKISSKFWWTVRLFQKCVYVWGGGGGGGGAATPLHTPFSNVLDIQPCSLLCTLVLIF